MDFFTHALAISADCTVTDATEVSVFRSHREIITMEVQMKTPVNGLQPNQKIALIQRLFERIYDPKSTVKEIAQLVESVPTLKNSVLGLVKQRSGGRINVRNCAQAIVLIGFNHLSRLAAICLTQLSEQLDALTSGPHRLTPPRGETFVAGVAQTST